MCSLAWNALQLSQHRPQPSRRPAPLRTHDQPYRLSDITPSDADKVHAGNVLAQFSLEISEDCVAAKIPVTIEPPHTSRLWKLPGFASRLRQCQVRAGNTSRILHWCRIDFCQDGTPWRKRAALLSAYIDLKRQVRHCCGTNVCSRTTRPHQCLRGSQPSSGRFFTIVAGPYPRSFCGRIVHAYSLALHRKMMKKGITERFAGQEPPAVRAVGQGGG